MLDFPQKLATGDSFCNRTKEQVHLKENILSSRPTLIMSPRRYGKTSLGIQVIKKLNIAYAHVDLFPMVTETDIQNSILSCIGDILTSLESSTEKAFKLISEFFSGLHISFKWIGQEVEINLPKEAQSSNTILSALKNLEKILKKKDKKAILFLDEFQRLSQITNSEAIEGAIRHVAQQSEQLCFIFSGSNRHLLSNVFEDSRRPLYKLCDRIILNKISYQDHFDFIQKAAMKKWNSELDKDTLDEILNLTECHSYYVNVLCARLWRQDSNPTSDFIKNTWHDYALEEKSTVFKEVEGLSANQFKLLIALSRYGKINKPNSKEFLDSAQLAISSARQALKILEEKDFLYRDKEHYIQVTDPLLKYILINREHLKV